MVLSPDCPASSATVRLLPVLATRASWGCGHSHPGGCAAGSQDPPTVRNAEPFPRAP